MKSKYNLIGSLGTFFSGDYSVLHIKKYMELKNINIPLELGISLNTEALRVIKTLTEGYAAVYMILDHVNNKAYIGSTFGNGLSSVHRRLSEHKTSWLKDLKNYEFYILKSYPVKELLALNDSSSIKNLDKVIREFESSLIIDIKPEYNANSYVKTYTGINIKQTSEAIKIMQDASAKRSGPSSEHREEMIKENTGTKLSETHKEKIIKGGRPIKIVLATKEELCFNSILEALDNDWIAISERTLKRRLADNKEFKTEKGIATAIYAEKIDSSKIINDPNFIRIMKDISFDTNEKRLEALILFKIVYPKTNKRVKRERLEQAIANFSN